MIDDLNSNICETRNSPPNCPPVDANAEAPPRRPKFPKLLRPLPEPVLLLLLLTKSFELLDEWKLLAEPPTLDSERELTVTWYGLPS